MSESMIEVTNMEEEHIISKRNTLCMKESGTKTLIKETVK